MPLLKQSALTSSVRDKGLCLLNVVCVALCTDKYTHRGLLCCIYSYLSTKEKNRAKDALVNPTAAQTTAADKAIEAAEKTLEKAADKADGGPAAANAAASKAASDMRIVSYYDLDVSATAETQTGVTLALGFDMCAVQKVDYDDDYKIEVQGQQSVMQTYLQHMLAGH